MTGGNHSYNRAEKVARISGATIRLAAVSDQKSYDVLQGANATMLIVDEVTQYPSERLLRLLRSNLRGPAIMSRPASSIMGNPGGPLHGRIHKNHVQDRQSHVPYHDRSRRAARPRPGSPYPSGPMDNPFINHAGLHKPAAAGVPRRPGPAQAVAVRRSGRLAPA